MTMLVCDQEPHILALETGDRGSITGLLDPWLEYRMRKNLCSVEKCTKGTVNSEEAT